MTTPQSMAEALASVPPLLPASPHKRRRILMLSTAIGVGGGAEEQVMLLSLGLRARGWDVKIVSLVPLFPLSADLQASDICVTSLGMKRGVPDPRGLLRLMKELRSFEPDVVHCHMPQANLLARLVRPVCGFPVLISTLHNLTMERINGKSGCFLERAHAWTDRFSDKTTVICTAALRSYVESGAAPLKKLAVLYNGVDTAKFQPNAQARRQMRRDLGVEGKFVWLAIGRFERAKDYQNMIQAFAALLQRTTQQIELLICGRGSLEPDIRALVRDCGLTERVRFLGVRHDIPEVMNAADGFVLSSYLEGLPMVLLQASSIGVPIVATDVGGNSEIVIEGMTGFLVPPRNSAALAGAMERLSHLPEPERALMAARARQLASEQFAIEGIIDRWEALYAEHLNKKTSAESGKRKGITNATQQ